jgi:predicted flavoprotein YhiN
MEDDRYAVAVIGAGAAGIFAALAARGALDAKGAFSRPPAAAPRVLLLDSKEKVGRKILISGGGRCNATNAVVTDRDFDTDAPAVVRGVLAGFPVASVRAFFRSRGVDLAEEPVGKLFPRDGNAKGVLAALLGAVEEAGVGTAFGAEVREVAPDAGGWRVGGRRARRAIVATGGRSIPATGSAGFGYALAESLGHAVVPPVPALAALRGATPARFAGVTVPAILTVSDPEGRVLRRAAGSLLFTHGGVSGPAALDASVAVARALAEGRPFRVRADLWTLADPAGPWARFLGLPKAPGSCLAAAPVPAEAAAVERHLLEETRRDPRRTAGAVLGERIPRRLVEALVPAAGAPLGRLPREARRAAAEAVAALDLGITGTDGFERAEVTAGGVPLRELHRVTLESRRAPGLHFCGEVCNATGRLGGFNFQWAWSSGFAAGRGAAGR